jgi:predicted transcriptional regulator
MSWKLLSFVLRSKQRREIILTLNKPKTPTQIAHDTDLSVAHVSRTLREFTTKGIVKCETPHEKIGRIYRLTEEGRKIMKNLRR